MSSTSFEKTFTIGGELTVQRMGYGAMRITGKGIWGPPEDHDEAIRVLKRAVERGVNFIDTADSYGPNVSETLIAEALHPYQQGLLIATKGGFERTGPNQWQMNGRPEHLTAALAGSLQRLKVDRIDLYQLHRIDPRVPFEKMMECLAKAQQDGLIRHIGLSEVSVDQIKKAETFVKIVSVQNKYSVDNRNWETVLQYCEETGKAFIPWNPLNANNADSMGKLEGIAKRHHATPHQVALSWLLHHSPNILLIPGTSSVKHLEENLDAAELALDATALQELDIIAG